MMFNNLFNLLHLHLMFNIFHTERSTSDDGCTDRFGSADYSLLLNPDGAHWSVHLQPPSIHSSRPFSPENIWQVSLWILIWKFLTSMFDLRSWFFENLKICANPYFVMFMVINRLLSYVLWKVAFFLFQLLNKYVYYTVWS